jgi:hypothetical protein
MRTFDTATPTALSLPAPPTVRMFSGDDEFDRFCIRVNLLPNLLLYERKNDDQMTCE